MNSTSTTVLMMLSLATFACDARVDKQEEETDSACPADQSRCDGVCVVTRYDPNHCGACGTACHADHACLSGRCVPVSTTGSGADGSSGTSNSPGTSSSRVTSSSMGTSGLAGTSGSGINPWIASNFADVPVMTGDFTSRTNVELPRLVRDATGTNAKYAFDLKDAADPRDPRVAFVNVRVTNLRSSDAWGGAIQSSSAAGAVLFLSHVYVEPNWPTWQDYSSTNYDGLVLDGSAAIYAEDTTIANWNADSAIDIKSTAAQFVRLRTDGSGNRTLRFWAAGPHYIVDSTINNTGTVGEGSLLWISDCATTRINVYHSTFNGSSTVPANKVKCDNGSAPEIVYLTTDPRTTGEMHPMFSAN